MCAAAAIWCGGIWIQVWSESVCAHRTACNRKEANGQHYAIFIKISVPVSSHDLCNHVCSFSLDAGTFTTMWVLLLKIMWRLWRTGETVLSCKMCTSGLNRPDSSQIFIHGNYCMKVLGFLKSTVGTILKGWALWGFQIRRVFRTTSFMLHPPSKFSLWIVETYLKIQTLIGKSMIYFPAKT